MKKNTKKVCYQSPNFEIPAECLFQYVGFAPLTIKKCPHCGCGFGIREYRNTLTKKKVFSCEACIETLTI
jgi:hypothetical protein